MTSWDQELKDHFQTSNWIIGTVFNVTFLDGNTSSIFIVSVLCDAHWNNIVFEITII